MVKVIITHRGDGIIRGEVPFEEDHLHKMTKDTTIEVADIPIGAVTMKTAIIITITITEAEEDHSNKDLGGPRNSNPGEEVMYLKQEWVTQSTDTYPNTDTYVGFVVIKVIMTINAIHYSI